MLAQSEGRSDGPLKIHHTRYGDDVIVLKFAGELDLATIPDARRMFESALLEPEAMILIDLTELEFIDAKGIGLLVGLAGSRPDKEALRLLPSTHEGVNRVLELTGVDTMIPVVAG